MTSSAAEIHFFRDGHGALFVTIDTERLHLQSMEATEKEYERHAALFADPEIMEKYSTGETRTKERVVDEVNKIWVERWRNNDPYSRFSVFIKESDAFLGQVTLGHVDEENHSELAYLFHRQYWGKGYGSEAVAAVVKEYSSEIMERGYLYQGRKLEKIVATARPDNPASCRILEKLGMHVVREEPLDGYPRRVYEKEVSLKC